MDEVERVLTEAVVINLNEQTTYFTADNEERNKEIYQDIRRRSEI